jgi:hypothetical protein
MGADLVSADLEALAERINAEHEQFGNALRAGLHHALEAGRLLLEAKAGLPHGAWLPWLRDNCKVPERTAQLYMRLARELPARLGGDESARLADLSITEAVDLLARPREPEPRQVVVRSAVPPESREPVRAVVLTRMPVQQPDPSGAQTLGQRLCPKLDMSALRTIDLSRELSFECATEEDLSFERATEEDLSFECATEAGLMHEPLRRQEVGVAAAGERTRVIRCGEALEGASTLTEVVSRLNRLAQQLLALKDAGWQLQAPMTGNDEVVIGSVR